MRDEHREDYDPGRGGWGAQAQAQRRKEVEERYADTTGIVAGGGGEWKQGEIPIQTLKRGRSPDDDGEQERVSLPLFHPTLLLTLLHRQHVLAWMWRIVCEVFSCRPVFKVSDCSLIGRQEQGQEVGQMITVVTKVLIVCPVAQLVRACDC